MSIRCILFVGDGKDEAGTIQSVDMVPLTIYNVKQGTWHHHTNRLWGDPEA